VLPPYLRVDYRLAERVIVDFIKESVEEAGAEGVVIGLSGGGDSAVAAALTVKALGPGRVRTLFLPDRESDKLSQVIAYKVADRLGIRFDVIDITGVVTEFLSALGYDYRTAPRIPKGNIKVRSRMTLLYSVANFENRLVVGTSDRSEWLIGYFTKWGDGAADIYPIIGLYKTQVREFAKYLDLPIEVVTRPSTPDLWPGHTAEGELGVTYDVIDEVLYRVFDEGVLPDVVPKVAGISKDVVDRVMELHRRSEHKRVPLRAPFRSFIQLRREGVAVRGSRYTS